MDKQKMGNRRVVGYDIRPVPRASKVPPVHQKKPSILASLKAITSPAKAMLLKLPRKVLILIGISVLIVVIVLAISSRQAASSTQKVAVSTPAPSKPGPALQHGTPDYTTILPTNKSIGSLGGWTRVSPTDRNPVFAYLDKIGDTQIIVSQQPLPSGLDVDSDTRVEQLAQGYNANEKITAGGTSVYIGTSTKGPQSVIFSKSNLLILIKSSTTISDGQWSAYVNSLH